MHRRSAHCYATAVRRERIAVGFDPAGNVHQAGVRSQFNSVSRENLIGRQSKVAAIDANRTLAIETAAFQASIEIAEVIERAGTNREPTADAVLSRRSQQRSLE